MSTSPTTGLRREFHALLHRLWKKRLLLFLSLLVTAGCLWLLRRGALPVVPSSEAFAELPLGFVALYGASFCLVQWLRAIRWKYLLRPLAELDDREIVAGNLVFFGALLVLPLRLGEFVRPALLRRPGRLSAWQVMGLVGAERVVDGLVSSSILVSALLLTKANPDLVGLPAMVRPLALAMAAIFAGLLVGIFAFYFFRDWARRVVLGLFGVFSRGLAVFVADKVDGVAAGLAFLKRPRDAIPFALVTVLYWAVNVLSTLFLLVPTGLTGAGVVQAGTIIGVLALGLLVPGAPGFFGTFQLSVYAALSITAAPEELATKGAVVVFWMYVVQILCILATALASLPLSLRRLAQSDGAQSDGAQSDGAQSDGAQSDGAQSDGTSQLSVDGAGTERGAAP